MRERAALLAGEIPVDYPDLTVHDLSHLDALWELADLFAGDALTLNCAEAFVFGGAILVHDLALGLSAYPGGIEELRAEPIWRDIFAREERAFGRVTGERLALREQKVTKEALRRLHAERAGLMLALSWNIDGEPIYLLEDRPLREYYGPLIGKIGASHGFSPDRILSELDIEIPPPGIGLPNHWSVDQVKLAGLLRVVDAAHIDQRRAPFFLRALRRPTGESLRHWQFQERMSQPRVVNGHVRFAASPAFGVKQNRAWWLAYDALRVLDREIRDVNSLFATADRPFRLAATGVEGIESPASLARYIPVDGWEPVDARVRVSDVASLVNSLGGRQLYGRDAELVPLRELLQNARDAIVARRLLQSSWEGRIVVSIDAAPEPKWLSVADNGVGMSRDGLLSGLLDFGTSYWRTGDVLLDLPDLFARGFEPAGAFGIGFYSVFMWSRRISVRTRRFDATPSDTRVLRFEAGVSAPPILRLVPKTAELPHGGTVITLFFANTPRILDDDSDLASFPDLFERVAALVKLVAPALDVSVFVRQGDRIERVIEANDWLTIPHDELLARIAPDDRAASLASTGFVNHIETLTDASGGLYGRAALVVSPLAFAARHGPGALVDRAGLRIGDLHTVAGVLRAVPANTARNQGVVFIPSSALETWSRAQVNALKKLPAHERNYAAALLADLDGDPGSLPLAFARGRYVTAAQIKRLVARQNEVVLARDEDVPFPDDHSMTASIRETWALDRNVFLLPYPMSDDFTSSGRSRVSQIAGPLAPLVIRTIAASWREQNGDSTTVTAAQRQFGSWPDGNRDGALVLIVARAPTE